MDFATIIAGLSDALTPLNLMFVFAGVFVGQFVGAMPGIGPVMAMAIAIPFTFALNPLPAIGFLVGVNKGGLIGGAIPAILLNTPGTPDAAATALDGYPLTQKGKPLKALKMALYSSVTGDTFSDIVLITIAAPLAILALTLGPVEIFALMVFAFSLISGLIGRSFTKGIIATAFGLLVATVGLDPNIQRRNSCSACMNFMTDFLLPLSPSDRWRFRKSCCASRGCVATCGPPSISRRTRPKTKNRSALPNIGPVAMFCCAAR